MHQSGLQPEGDCWEGGGGVNDPYSVQCQVILVNWRVLLLNELMPRRDRFYWDIVVKAFSKCC